MADFSYKLHQAIFLSLELASFRIDCAYMDINGSISYILHRKYIYSICNYWLWVHVGLLTVLLSGVASTDYRSYIYGHIHNMCHRDICIYVQGAGMENNMNCYIEGMTLKFVFCTWWSNTQTFSSKTTILLKQCPKNHETSQKKILLLLLEYVEMKYNLRWKRFFRSVLLFCTWQLWLTFFTKQFHVRPCT